MSGPVPKHSSERRRRNKSDVPVTSAPAARVVVEQPEASDGWHPMARDWYESLAASGQAAFYEASDWQQARVWAEVLSRQLTADRVSAQMIAAWSAGATELLTTEGARRRARVELARPAADEDDDAANAAVVGYIGVVGA